MFDSSCPPLLVQPVNKEFITLFPTHEGYQIHSFPGDQDQALIAYRDGWTVFLSVQQQKYVTTTPLLMVRNSGGVTTSSTTTTKGYAHEFCQENGQKMSCLFEHALFPDQINTNWMFIQDTITMVWLQYENKIQYCGSTFDMERIYCGKLLIRRFDIKEDISPGLDKKADKSSYSSKQFRVESNQIYLDSWNVTDTPPGEHLQNLLSLNGLDRYQNAVANALERASKD